MPKPMHRLSWKLRAAPFAVTTRVLHGRRLTPSRRLPRPVRKLRERLVRKRGPVSRSTCLASPRRHTVTSWAPSPEPMQGGIYRVYPLYVHALRAIFAQSLVGAIRERWPRIRGVFWDETEASITELASRSLRERLTRVLEVGIQRGDLVRDGTDPADDLAERLWTDPAIREAALRALNVDPHDPLPMLATPADSRLLDDTISGPLILVVPATLEPLMRASGGGRPARVVVTNAIEWAAVLKVFPFQPGLYDLVDLARAREPVAT